MIKLDIYILLYMFSYLGCYSNASHLIYIYKYILDGKTRKSNTAK